MESNSNAGQLPSVDPHVEAAPVAQTISCCTDGHHHHSHSSLSSIGYQTLAMIVAASPASQATPHTAVARASTSVGKSSGSKNRKRKRTSRACVYCQKLHLSCDEQRPCIRCVKAGRADQCKVRDFRLFQCLCRIFDSSLFAYFPVPFTFKRHHFEKFGAPVLARLFLAP
jgi:hypothetical protein